MNWRLSRKRRICSARRPTPRGCCRRSSGHWLTRLLCPPLTTSALRPDLPRRPDREGSSSRPAPRETVFQPEFRDDLRSWVQTDRRVALRILELVEAIVRDPFVGIGKPEPLKHLG